MEYKRKTKRNNTKNKRKVAASLGMFWAISQGPTSFSGMGVRTSENEIWT